MILFPTVDEDYQYFVSQGYNGAINDMHYQALGDLGYTGSYTDRLYAYLVATYGSYHQALYDLRTGVSTFSLLGYSIGGVEPALVLNFAADYYRTGGSTSTFDNSLTYTGASSKTMVDSDGLVKWAPHNIVLNSATPATQNITVVSGQDYTVECTGTGSITLSGAGSGSASLGSPVEITAGTTTLTLTIVGSVDTMWCYRSDLGGMVDNPDRGDSYVPTTSAAVYLPRRGHHIYNGSTWVNEGILLESEARTNLEDYSDLSSGVTLVGSVTLDLANVTGPAGPTTAATLTTKVGSGTQGFATVQSSAGATNHTMSIFAKSNGVDYLQLIGSSAVFAVNVWGNFDLATGVIGSMGTAVLESSIENVGDGWYRCSITGLADGSSGGGGPYMVASASAGRGNGVTGDGVDGVLLYGLQFEEGSTPSSYIPTAGATVTRAAETLTVAAANLPYNSVNMSMQMDGEMTYADEATAAQITLARWYADASNYIILDVDTDTTATGEINANQNAVGTLDTVVATVEYSPGVSIDVNISSRHTSGAINVAKDGTAATEDTTPTALPDLSATNMQLGYTYMGTIGKFRMWDADLGDTGIAEAST
jgi:hypothetical protein